MRHYVASLSCGKDSLAMVLKLIELNYPLTDVVMFDTGMEFQSIYMNLEKIEPLITEYGSDIHIIKPKTHWLEQMLISPVCEGKCDEHYGYEWCGGTCRWRTSDKVSSIQRLLNSFGDYTQYIGIAFDEPDRIKEENNKTYPLVEWKMTEADCLRYCYDKGFDWNEDGVELYSVLDRVSCWCCGNKNLKELRNMYHKLPYYWGLLKGLQSRIDRPFYQDKTIFQLEERFKNEDAQMTIFDFVERGNI